MKSAKTNLSLRGIEGLLDMGSRGSGVRIRGGGQTIWSWKCHGRRQLREGRQTPEGRGGGEAERLRCCKDGPSEVWFSKNMDRCSMETLAVSSMLEDSEA